MSFSTLSYNQEEASSIISQITTPGTFLHTPSEELRTREFEKDLRRFTALDLHSITLAEYHRVQRIPRGLRVPLRPTLFQENTEFCTKFESILNKCSMDLIVLTIDFLQKEISELKTKITSSEQQLKSTSSPEDFQILKEKIDKNVSDLRDTLQARKRNKFLTTSCSGQSRKTRRGRRLRPRSTQDDDQISGTDISSNIVYNISSYCLSPSEMTILQKDLALSSWNRNFYRFFRNVRLKAHFSNSSISTALPPEPIENIFTSQALNLRVPSTFQPPHFYHPVETYIDFVKKDIQEVLGSIVRGDIHIKNNLTNDEHRALLTLKENKELIIKPADKGGAIVILDRSYYMDEIRNQLNDLDTYQPVSYNPSFSIAREIKELITHYRGLGTIDEKLGHFLINPHPVIPVFYTLPKVHKHLTKPPGRPIVASTNSIFSPLAITLDKILSPLVPHIVSFLKDTTDFLTSLQGLGTLPRDCILVSMDVNSLYTSIRHVDGVEAVMLFLSQHTNFSIDQLNFCKDLLTLILTKNIFLFEDQFYIQKRGTAMGSNTSYVYPHPSFKLHVIYWKRFIDDIFFIWTGDDKTLLSFYKDLNEYVPGLTFSISHDSCSMNFLDTTVIIKEGRNIETDLYVKPTDKNSLLRYDSCHPKHVKKSLPKSQHIRIDRIVSNPDTRRTGHHDMNTKFQNRGYPHSILVNSTNENRTSLDHKIPRLAFLQMFLEEGNWLKR
ncbi:unnamed protein product [Ranitomeya imitator]|uniref:Helix-turn-helix domain-containing protein n=1 Tax=Ranitomeya imitator TaxID=111125 RepID=A0ABN9LJ23_9NEOB|nr:unnamed protein product [Ranitomeya imitator]